MAARAYMWLRIRTMTGQRYIDEVLLPHVRLFHLNPIENVWDAWGGRVAGPKLSSDKQEHPHPCTHRRNGINCLNSFWIMLCNRRYEKV
ncbi:hypothetical protein TNCV_3632001 [Trichonephila clavipes]|nr:hypothetical protein TNCV_3632001 [Trichonephila clavipes]